MTKKPTSDDFYDAPPLQVAAQYLRWQADRDYWGHNEPMELRMLADRLEAAFAAERNAGFREAADWLEAGDFYDCSSGYIIKEIRAEADRLEKK